MATQSAAPTYGIPARTYAGVTTAWLASGADTPNGAGWTVRAIIAGADTVEVAATTSGGNYLVTIPASVTGGLPAGVYTVTVLATNAGTGEVAAIDRGTMRVVSLGAAGADARHPDEVALVAAYEVRAQLLADALQEYTAGESGAGRSVKRKSLDEVAREIGRLELRITKRRNAGRGRPVRLTARPAVNGYPPLGWPWGGL